VTDEKFRSAEVLRDKILSDDVLIKQLQADPSKVLKEQTREVVNGLPAAMQSDPWIWRMGILALLLGIVISAASLAILSLNDKTTPEGLLSIGTACIAAIAGLLVPSPVKT
jgi:hypothetical protein